MHGLTGDDEIFGFDRNDKLYGGADDDDLSGGAGNDILNGGGGRDDLTGDTGADTFRFHLASESTVFDFDTIRDFSRAEGDKIDLSFIDANTVLSGNDAFTLGTAFTGAAGQLVITPTESGQMVQGDVNGDRLADFAFEVRTHSSSVPLSEYDFIF